MLNHFYYSGIYHIFLNYYKPIKSRIIKSYNFKNKNDREVQSTDALMFPSFNPDKTYFQHQKNGPRLIKIKIRMLQLTRTAYCRFCHIK